MAFDWSPPLLERIQPIFVELMYKLGFLRIHNDAQKRDSCPETVGICWNSQNKMIALRDGGNLVLRRYVRVILFLSSYSPMFIIFALRNPFKNAYAAWGLFFLGALSIWMLHLVLVTTKLLAPEIIEVGEIEFKGGESMSYVVTYIIPFLGVDFSSADNYVSLLIVFLVLAVLYMNSSLIYTNPLLNMMGYQIYRIQDTDGRNIMLLTKEKQVRARSRLPVTQVEGNVYLGG